MKDELISFEIAKLAKEKGFKGSNSVSINTTYYYLWLCELQKWIRDIYKINIIINFCDDDTWEASLQTDNFPEKESDKDTPEFYTYEDCLENALKEALELL